MFKSETDILAFVSVPLARSDFVLDISLVIVGVTMEARGSMEVDEEVWLSTITDGW